MKRIVLLVLLVFLVMSWLSVTFAQQKILRVSGENYAPYVGESLPEQGWAWAVAKAALEEVGYKGTMNFMPWVRAMEEGKRAKWDAIYPAYWKTERTQWFVFSVPIGDSVLGFFKLKEREDIIFNGDLTSLKEYLIGVCRGCAISPEFDSADYLKKQFQADSIHLLKQLYIGRIDLFAGNFYTDGWKIRELSKNLNYKDAENKFEFIYPALKKGTIHMAISKKAANHLVLLRDFNNGMRKIMTNGTYNKILKRFKVK